MTLGSVRPPTGRRRKVQANPNVPLAFATITSFEAAPCRGRHQAGTHCQRSPAWDPEGSTRSARQAP
eukprot:11603387-Prorocentrum_lima.AAC.1